MRIVLAPEGTRGDVHPLLALGVRLREAGHAVRLCASPDFEADARARGLEFRPVGGSIRAYLGAEAGAIHAGPLALVRASWRYMRDNVTAWFFALSEVAPEADLLVGAGVQLAAPSVAEWLRIPYRYVAYCPGIVPSAEHAPIFLARQPGTPRANRIAWRATAAAVRAGPGRLVDRHRRRLGLRPIADVARHLFGARPLLAVDRELAEAPADAPWPLDQVPCLHPFAPEPLPAKLEGFLDAGPPPVYVGFGSMPDPRPGETTRRVLDAVRARGLRAVIDRGWAGLGEGPLGDDVFVTEPVSHAALFRRVAAVVHHGGAGTTATAARAGAPQLVVPHVLDQFYWAARTRALGLGPPPVPRRELTAERLAEALAELVENEILAERAAELGERLRRRAQEEIDLDALLVAPARGAQGTPRRLDAVPGTFPDGV